MKFFIVLGGFLGFVLVMGVGLAAGRHSSMLLLEASVASVIVGTLFRWWYGLLVRQVRLAMLERRAAAAKPVDQRASRT